ncbi:PREDICTED: dehydrogenase/reductase SDR family member 11-like [Polistes dominula]|uniref:Dehydrogenase/reductase SDR family member 11-like n=1 Tax=Polistes dominula TaxID=743375 RepID=A0ABM1HV06_POLDO|nr:PREDICTED: dehydrogenase/reductase SDR family member 11-like [Polistes dominula]
MERWSGKVALVTGASTGIGAKIAEELARYNLKVVAIARRLHKLEELKAKVESLNLPGTIYPMKCDLRNEEEILNVFKYIQKEHDEVNILINNAGVIFHEKIIDGKTENFHNIMDVNVIAIAICTREAVKLMSKSKNQGHIININSVSGHNAQNIKLPFSLYPCSKYALRAMCDSVRNEIQNDKLSIKISNISPSIVNTDMVKVFNLKPEILDKIEMLSIKNITDGIIYVLASPINVEINELGIKSVHGILPEKI